MTKADQLRELEQAYERFAAVVTSLSPTQFLRSLGDWTPRDVLAHLIGWNRNILVGCQQIQVGATPFYHADAQNDYRHVNAEFIARFDSTDREALLRELAKGKDLLTSYLEGVDEGDWERDFGVSHYRGGTATVARAAESIIRDYTDHAREIVEGTAREASLHSTASST